MHIGLWGKIVLLYLFSLTYQHSIAQNPYPNLDFSQGDFSNWNVYSGVQTGSGGTRSFVANPTTAPSAQFAIITPGAQPKDPNTCYDILRIPAGKNYSIRVGPLSPGGYGNPLGYRISYTFTVSALRPTFIYQFAFVQQYDHGTSGGDPNGFGGGTGGSGPANNAQMAVSTLDAGGNPAGGVCGNYRLYPGVATNVSWFQWSHCGEVSNTPWITDVIDLTPYIGQTLTIEFTTMDCYTGHHMAYSYISPSTATRDTTAYYCPGTATTLTAPGGFKTYSWQEVNGAFNQVKQNAAITGQDIAGVNELKINNPVAGTKYECTFTSYNGCSGKMIYELKPDSVHASYSSVLSSTTCQQQNFTDLSSVSFPVRSSISQWKWSFGDPTSGVSNSAVLQNPIHHFNSAGTYQVKLVTTSSKGCKDSITSPVTIIQQENADFNFTTGTCQKDTVFFTDVSTGTIASRQWNFGDGSPLSSDILPSHTYSSAGIFNVSLKIISPTGCENNKTKPVTVFPTPVSQFNLPSPICLEKALAPVELSAIASPGHIQSWKWDFGDASSILTTQQVSHTYYNTGSYTVSLITTSADGCNDTLCKTVTVAPGPNVHFTLNKQDGCVPLCIESINSSNIATGSINSYQWTSANVTIGNSVNLNWCTQAVGAQNIFLTATSDKGCISESSATIEVFPSPESDFISDPPSATLENPTINFSNTSSGANQYRWTFGDHAPEESNRNTEHTYTYSGSYEVTLISSNSYGCIDTTSHRIVIDSIYSVRIPNAFSPNGDGIHDVFEIDNIRFFPNAVLEIFNQWGEQVYTSDPGYTTPWDGSRNGKLLSASSYYYILTINNNSKKSLNGYITLIR